MTQDEFKAARQTLGMSQKALAAALGFVGDGRLNIIAYENGHRKIPGPVQLAMKYLLMCQPEPTRATHSRIMTLTGPATPPQQD